MATAPKPQPLTARGRDREAVSEDAPAPTRREEILTAAAAVFSDRGYQASTIQDIAGAMGFTSAALYYYFSSKQEILSEIITRPVHKLIAMAEGVEAEPLTGMEKLNALIHRHIGMMLGEREPFIILLRERVELSEDGAARLAELEDQYYARVRSIIVAAQEAGEFRDVNAKMAALALIGMVNWVLRWYRDGRDLAPAQIADMMFDTFYRGVAAGPDGSAGSGKPAANRSRPAPARKRNGDAKPAPAGAARKGRK